MGDPSTVAGFGLGTNVFGSLFGAFGKYEEGKAQSNMYNYRAAIAELNSQIALQNRDYALQSGDRKAVQIGMKGSQQIGAIRAAQGASGMDVGSGSAVQVRAGQHKAVAFDLQTQRENTAREQYAYQAESVQDVAQAGLYKTAAATSMQAGEIGAISSLVSGAGSVSDKWLSMRQYGISTG